MLLEYYLSEDSRHSRSWFVLRTDIGILGIEFLAEIYFRGFFVVIIIFFCWGGGRGEGGSVGLLKSGSIHILPDTPRICNQSAGPIVMLKNISCELPALLSFSNHRTPLKVYLSYCCVVLNSHTLYQSLHPKIMPLLQSDCRPIFLVLCHKNLSIHTKLLRLVKGGSHSNSSRGHSSSWLRV